MNVANTPSVTLAGIPVVSLASGSAVSISGTPSVSLAGAATTRRSADVVVDVGKTTFLDLDYDSGDLAVGAYTELALDMLAGSSRLVGPACCGPCVGTLDVTVSRRAAGGTYFAIDHFVLADLAIASRSFGAGATQNVSFGGTLKIHVHPTAAATNCGATYTLSVIGK